MSKLNSIANCDNPDRAGDVIFVHGLDGDWKSTWQRSNEEETFWPAWLGDDFPNVGVWSLSYDVSSSAWKGRSMPLSDRARNVLNLLELDGVGERPIMFVCHSLGGLLVKQVLRHASDSRQESYRRIASAAQAIVFLSTPHSGSDLADWVQYLGKILRATVSVDELEAHNPSLRELNRWYRNHVDEMGIKTFVFFESYKTKGVLVVNPTTADPGITGIDPIPLDDDHITICKLPDRESQVYRQVKKLLRDHILNP